MSGWQWPLVALFTVLVFACIVIIAHDARKPRLPPNRRTSRYWPPQDEKRKEPLL